MDQGRPFQPYALTHGVKILSAFADIFNRRNEMIVHLILGVTLVFIAVVIYHINVKDRSDG